jgi:FkbM family methyltransferase
MNFSSISDQSPLGKLARLPLKLIPAQSVVPVLQGRLKGKKWIVGSFDHGCWLGSYEYHKRLAFESEVKEGAIVFDIGAHVGFYTLLASVLVGPSGKVFAFEPHPRNLRYLKEHLRLNAIANVRIIEAAVSDFNGASWMEEGRNSCTAHLASQGTLQVTTLSLDDAVSRGELPIPGYIKIDVEGAELQALSGASSILQSVHPVLFLATHGRGLHARCCELLTSLGYQLEGLGPKNAQDSDEILASY